MDCKPLLDTMAEAKKTKTTQKSADEAESKQLSMPVYGENGLESKKVHLPKELFGIEARPRLLAQYVRVYQANQRQGTASTKTRGEVQSSSKKIYRQKGTGKARHGTITAPIFVGGGVVGGPKPRDYSLKMNKKQKQLALLYSLSLKAQEGSIFGLTDDIMKMEPKTKDAAALFNKIGVKKSLLCVVPEMADNGFVLSMRNLGNIKVIHAANLNAYQIIKYNQVAFVEKSLDVMKNSFIKNA